MDYYSRQTRQRYTQTEAYEPFTHLHTFKYSHKALSKPYGQHKCTAQYYTSMQTQTKTHTRAKQTLCIQGKQGDMSTARTMGGKQSQSTYCLSSIFPMSLGASILIMGVRVCVCMYVSTLCILHTFLVLFTMKRAAFQFSYEKRGRGVC